MTLSTFGRTLAFAAALAIPASPLCAQAALEQGSMLVGGSAGANVRSYDGSDDSILTVSLFPRAEYFIADRFAVGGTVGLGYSSSGDENTTSFSVGPALTWYPMERDGAIPYLRAGAGWGRSSHSGGFLDGEADFWSLDAGVGLLLLLNEAVGLETELFVQRTSSENVVAGDLESTSGGLRLGFAAFLP